MGVTGVQTCDLRICVEQRCHENVHRERDRAFEQRLEEEGVRGFFFQAEDGIRDIGVTGVQTCALPISTSVEIRKPIPTMGVPKNSATMAPIRASVLLILSELKTNGKAAGRRSIKSVCRPEERRVGKECRSRWPPYH